MNFSFRVRTLNSVGLLGFCFLTAIWMIIMSLICSLFILIFLLDTFFNVFQLGVVIHSL